jgi:hypothetical protein
MTVNRHESDVRAARYAQHVRDLARAFGIHIREDVNMAPHQAGAGHLRGDTSRRGIVIVPVIDESTYAVALHELGHCLSAFGMVNLHEGSKTMRATNQLSSRRDVLLQLEEERAAWEWAHHYALEWTDIMSYVERYAIGTYEAMVRRMGYRP